MLAQNITIGLLGKFVPPSESKLRQFNKDCLIRDVHDCVRQETQPVYFTLELKRF